MTAATLRLFPRPAAVATAFVALDSPAAALALLGMLREAQGDAVTTFELLPRIALEFVVSPRARRARPVRRTAPVVRARGILARLRRRTSSRTGSRRRSPRRSSAGLVRDAVIAASEAQRADFWRLRETIPEAQGREGASLKHDISVEPARLPAFVDAGRALLERLAPGARLVAYGHLGDGNLHYNLSEPAGGDGGALAARAAEVRRAVHDLVGAHGGSISAEHGIGQLKVGELERYEDPVALDLMRTVKRAIDPHGIMNPGKVLRD